MIIFLTFSIATIRTTTSTRRTTPTTTIIRTSTYNGETTYSNPTFSRPGGNGGEYYYQTIPVCVPGEGFYSFLSTNIGSFVTSGFLYSNRFDPSMPSSNLIASGDGNALYSGFSFSDRLVRNTNYVLVVTSRDSSTTGQFTIYVTGPSSVRFARCSSKSIMNMNSWLQGEFVA